MKKKIKKSSLIDLTKEHLPQKYDVVYSSMALHHVKYYRNIVKILNDTLNDNGILCIIELDIVDPIFHSDELDFDGYNGFNHEQLGYAFEQAGLKNIEMAPFINCSKSINGKEVPFTLFYAKGEKI